MMRRMMLLWTIATICTMAGTAALAHEGAVIPDPQRATTMPAKALSLEQALERAAAVSLAEVTEVAEHDNRPADGNFEVTVTLKTVRGSGEPPTQISIVKEWGGLRPVDAGPPPPDPLNPCPFKKTARYWFVWSGEHDPYWHRILLWWPEGDAAAPAKALEAAIKADRYAWSPQYVPEAKVFYGRKVDAQNKQTQVRVTREGKTVWEKTVPGLPTSRYAAWGLFEKSGVAELADVDAPDKASFLLLETDTTLPQTNDYDQPAGRCYLRHMFALDTGRLGAVQISAAQDPQVTLGLCRYSLATGKMVLQRVYTHLPTGGKAAGAEKEDWWRQIDRRFDPKTGKKTGEETFRLEGPQMEPVKIDAKERR